MRDRCCPADANTVQISAFFSAVMRSPSSTIRDAAKYVSRFLPVLITFVDLCQMLPNTGDLLLERNHPRLYLVQCEMGNGFRYIIGQLAKTDLALVVDLSTDASILVQVVLGGHAELRGIRARGPGQLYGSLQTVVAPLNKVSGRVAESEVVSGDFRLLGVKCNLVTGQPALIVSNTGRIDQRSAQVNVKVGIDTNAIVRDKVKKLVLLLVLLALLPLFRSSFAVLFSGCLRRYLYDTA
uniref:Uncharacterized protein n=1 Tax=Anopheles culicifacies TaxID=139723 RepID=A0A182M6K9_9DIPT